MVKLLKLVALASTLILSAGTLAQEAEAEAPPTYNLSMVAPGHLDTACAVDCDAFVCVQGVRNTQNYSLATAIYHNEMVPAHRDYCNAAAGWPVTTSGSSRSGAISTSCTH